MAEQPRTYPQGVTCWVDVEQADVDRALEFYGAVLGLPCSASYGKNARS